MSPRIPNVWKGQLETLGAFIRAERQLANMTLRELASVTDLSNAYLSQVERGLHEPSVRVLRSISDALGVPLTTVLARAGLIEDADVAPTPQAIAADPLLSPEQKDALLTVYRSYVADRKA